MGTDEQPPADAAPAYQWDADTAYEQIRSTIAELKSICKWRVVRYPIVDPVTVGGCLEHKARKGRDGLAMFQERKVYAPAWSQYSESHVITDPSADAAENMYDDLTATAVSLSGFPTVQAAVDAVRVKLYLWPHYSGLDKAIDTLIVECDKLRDKANWLPMSRDELAKRAIGGGDLTTPRQYIYRKCKEYKEAGEIVKRERPEDPRNPASRQVVEYRADLVRDVMDHFAHRRKC